MRMAEFERKFHIEHGRRVPDLAPDYVLGDRRRMRLTAVYVDTPDLRLTRAKVTLRRRTGGGDAGWHLKLPRGGDARLEVHAPLADGPAPSRVPAQLRAEVEHLLDGQPLVPVAVLRTARTEREVHTRRGRLVGVLTDDTVRVGSWHPDWAAPTNSAGDDGESTWRELELELAGATKANRASLDEITELFAAADIPVSTAKSKVGRFLAPRVAEVEERERAQTADGKAAAGKAAVSGRSRTSRPEAVEVVMAYIRAQVGVIQSREADVVADRPDAVHKSRVAARRLRSALRTGRRLFDAEVTEPMRVELRWWGQVLGEPRDAEVFRALVLDSLDELPAAEVVGPVRRRIHRELNSVHARAHRDAVRTMRSPRYTALLTALVGLVVDPPLRGRARRKPGTVHRQLVKHAVARVDARRRRAEKAGTAIAKASTDDAAGLAHARRDHWLHEVRKKSKATRYLGESLVEVHGAPARLLAERYEAVTDTLGQVQDAVVAVARLEAMRARAAAAGEPTRTYDALIRQQRAIHETNLAAGARALDALDHGDLRGSF